MNRHRSYPECLLLSPINSVWLVEENDNDKQMRHSGRQMTAVLAYVHFSDRICSRGHLSLSSALQDEVKTVVSNEWELASELFKIKLNWLMQGQLTLSQNCIFCTKSKVEWVLQRNWVQCSVSSSVQLCMCSVFWRGGVGGDTWCGAEPLPQVDWDDPCQGAFLASNGCTKYLILPLYFREHLLQKKVFFRTLPKLPFPLISFFSSSFCSSSSSSPCVCG